MSIFKALPTCMKNEYGAVIKAKECPACGALNRIKYEYNVMVVDNLCIFCGAMVRWKRRDTMVSKYLHSAFDDDVPELVPLEQYASR